MEELREIAKSYYDEGSTEVQTKATLFFESMDADDDKRVNLEEFLEFMRSQGYNHMRNNSFFRLLDRDGNGSLDFTDVMTLYYIIKSGRPFCDCCANFISGVFFTCVRCHNASPRSSFNICHPCHKSRTSGHSHDGGRAFFLDNYTLLQVLTSTSNETNTTAIRTTPIPSSSSSTQQIPTIHPLQRIPSLSTPPQSPTSFMKNKLNSMLEQKQLPSFPTRPNRDGYINTHHFQQLPSFPTVNTHQVNNPIRCPNRDGYINAIVPANPLQNRMKLAELAFKALEGALLLGNVFTALGGACTIM